jgi:hypothetical protein
MNNSETDISARENTNDVGVFRATIETRFQRLLLWDPNS